MALPCKQHTGEGTFLRHDLIDYYAQAELCCVHGWITQRDNEYRKLVEARSKTFAEIRRDVSELRGS